MKCERYEAYLASLPSSFDEFFQQAITKPPFDLPSNVMGFPPEDVKPPLYQYAKSGESALLPILRYFASKSSSIVEFGCREGYTTAAFMKGLDDRKYLYDGGGCGNIDCPNISHESPILYSVDINVCGIVNKFMNWDLPCEWRFVNDNVHNDKLAIPTSFDFLYVDDLHEYNHVVRELELHGPKARKFVGFHDTVSQGTVSMDITGGEGINRAISEFATRYGFREAINIPYNHGLIILERI